METEEISAYIADSGLKFGADEIAVITTHLISKQVRFANNEITVAKAWDEISAGILLKKDKRVLTASITDVSKKGVKDCLKDLMHMVKVISPHSSFAPLPEGPFKYEDIPNLYDKRIAKLSDENIAYVETAINSALEIGGLRVAGTLLSAESESSLVTSKNVVGKRRKTSINLVVRCLADGESSGMGVTCGTTLDDFDPEKAGRDAARLAKMSSNPTSEKAGRYSIILGRPASAVLFDTVAGMSSAFNIDSGFSCFVDKVGEKIGFEELTVYDNAREARGLGSTPFDDEGHPTRKNMLIENGILRTYLHNSLTAKKYGVKSTANAGWITPHAWNIVVNEGEFTEEELLEEVKDGLYINNLTYLRFQNYRTGDFSAIVRDGVFKVEDGEIVRAIKDLRLSDNLMHMLNSIDALSNERFQVHHWWMEWGTPSVITPLLLLRDVGFTVPTI